MVDVRKWLGFFVYKVREDVGPESQSNQNSPIIRERGSFAVFL